ncbi:hypothetical protein AcW1_006245 [Taiwanofungus camphoratus]|nr:hypothetical protein AcW1_006245 [Antrodia cinnamomea]
MAEGDESLVDKVVPRRAAARKASRLAAEQLESSPVSSDREGAGRSFGEPAKARGSIKYTYGGKGKNKNSPTKVRRPISETSPVRAKVRNATAVRITPKGRVSLGAKGNRPTTSSKSSTPGNGLTTLTDTDPEPEHLKEVRRRRPRDSTSARPVDVDKTLTPSGTRTKASNNVKSGLRSSSSRKRTLSRPPSDRSSSNLESNSVLTPLSSPEPDRPDVLPAFKPPSNRHMSTPGNKRGFSLSTLSSMPSSRAASTSSADKHVSLRSAETRHGTGAEDEAWDLSRLGPLVWVKVDTHGKAVDDEDEDVNTDTLWWPGKVISSRIPLRVTLFGDSPRHSQTDEIADVRIFTPSLSNILPMAARGILRFNENNYKHSARTSGMQESPKKKPRLDFEARWKNARDLMLKTDEEDNDGLPMMLSNYVRNDSSPSARSDARDWTDGKEGASISDDDNLGEPHGKVWRAPSCDPMYDIPGELVLAREQKSRKDHWPAQLQAYIKPTNRREKPKYKVLFYDGMTKLLGPDMFYTTMDKDFGTCQLGLDKFNYGMNEEHEELDTADDDIDPYSELEDDTVLRIASPLPSLPAPSPLDFTTNLSIADQFNYVKPVLAAVIKGEFEPARDRHDAFMRGAAARQKVCETAFARGNLRHEEVEELLRLVRGWARRREKREGLNTYKDSAEPSFVATAGDHVKFHDQASTNRPTFLRPLTPTSQLSMSDMEVRHLRKQSRHHRLSLLLRLKKSIVSTGTCQGRFCMQIATESSPCRMYTCLLPLHETTSARGHHHLLMLWIVLARAQHSRTCLQLRKSRIAPTSCYARQSSSCYFGGPDNALGLSWKHHQKNSGFMISPWRKRTRPIGCKTLFGCGKLPKGRCCHLQKVKAVKQLLSLHPHQGEVRDLVPAGTNDRSSDCLPVAVVLH